MKYFVFFLALILFLSCGSSYQYTQVKPNDMTRRVVPIHVDKNFSEGDRYAINDAIAQWNYSLNGFIKLNIVSTSFDMDPVEIKDALANNGYLFMKINSESRFIPDKISGETLASVDSIGEGHLLYIVRDRIDNKTMLRGVFLHEIGHLLGANHLNNSLMLNHYQDSLYQCIDLETMKQISRYQLIQSSNMNYCYPH